MDQTRGAGLDLPVKRTRLALIHDIRHHPVTMLMALPAVAYTFIFGYLTLPYVVIAFQNFSYRTGIFDSAWVGFQNFRFFFRSPRALTVIWNTIKLNFLFIVIGMAAALVLAIVVNEIRSKAVARVTQSTYLFPHFISWIVTAYIVYSLFSTRLGLVNQLLQSLGLSTVNWYSNPAPWTYILVFLRIWKGAGINVVIFLAAISGISNELYEAAIIDGASRLQRIVRITVPLILPTVAILTLLAVGRIFYSDFGMFYAIIGDNGLLYPTTDVIDTYVFRALRKTGDPAQAMAVGLFQSLMGFVFVYGSNWLTRRFFREGALF